jgi:hypothetical protein
MHVPCQKDRKGGREKGAGLQPVDISSFNIEYRQISISAGADRGRDQGLSDGTLGYRTKKEKITIFQLDREE